ncbi:MAG: sulfatase-like hydrolase/transferase [Phycisphaerales bacterium]
MSSFSRRLFMKSMISAAAGLSLQKELFSAPFPSFRKKNSHKKPNILVIMSDEHNANILGCYGNKIVNTPNLNQLSSSGITFENFYCNSPLCVPSRLSFTAGKYISHINAWSNASKLLGDDYPSIAYSMKSAGYDPYLCGKMHYALEHRYGFTEIGKSFTNQKPKSGGCRRRNPDDLTVDKNTEEGRFDDFHAGNSSRVLDHDKEFTDRTVDFLNNRKKSDKPFFMISGLLAPHYPLIVPDEYWEKYKDKIPMPKMPQGYIDSLPLNYKHLRSGFGMTDVKPETVKKGRELYYGLVEWMDSEVGKILRALKDNGLEDNTIVIYTSDHGENMGEHGLWWKNAMFNTASRIPLIISYPKRWKGSQRRLQTASLVDLTRTIADLGQAEFPKDWDGDSMVDWLDNSNYKWKDFAVSEYYAHNIASGYTMIRTADYKYVYHTPSDKAHKSQTELYNLRKDPDELSNLSNQDNYKDIISKLHSKICHELGENPDNTELRARKDFQEAIAKNEKSKIEKPKRSKKIKI